MVCNICGKKSKTNICPKCKKTPSLLTLVEKGNKKKIKDWENRASTGEIMRIM